MELPPTPFATDTSVKHFAWRTCQLHASCPPKRGTVKQCCSTKAEVSGGWLWLRVQWALCHLLELDSCSTDGLFCANKPRTMVKENLWLLSDSAMLLITSIPWYIRLCCMTAVWLLWKIWHFGACAGIKQYHIAISMCFSLAILHHWLFSK